MDKENKVIRQAEIKLEIIQPGTEPETIILQFPITLKTANILFWWYWRWNGDIIGFSIKKAAQALWETALKQAKEAKEAEETKIKKKLEKKKDAQKSR